MDRTAASIVLKDLIGRFRTRLAEAAGIAAAAEVCADGGNVERAVKMAMEYEDLASDAEGMFAAMVVIRRAAFGSDPFER